MNGRYGEHAQKNGSKVRMTIRVVVLNKKTYREKEGISSGFLHKILRLTHRDIIKKDKLFYK